MRHWLLVDKRGGEDSNPFAITPEEADNRYPDYAPHRVFVADTVAGTCVEIPRRLKSRLAGKTLRSMMAGPGSAGNYTIVESCVDDIASHVVAAHWRDHLTDDVIQRIVTASHALHREGAGDDTYYDAIRDAVKDEK